MVLEVRIHLCPPQKGHPKGVLLGGGGVLKNHRIIGGSREEARIAKFVPFTKFVADDTLAKPISTSAACIKHSLSL